MAAVAGWSTYYLVTLGGERAPVLDGLEERLWGELRTAAAEIELTR